LPAVVVPRHRFRFGVRDVNHVVLVDVDTAWPAVLLPLFDEGAVLIEDLNPVVIAIADEQTAARIHREAVRLIELAGPGAKLAPFLDELAGLVELEDPVVAGAVALRDEDVAVCRGDDVVGLIE